MTPKIWLAQLTARAGSAENLQKITETVRRAAGARAQMVVFPEYMMSYPDHKGGKSERQTLDGAFVTALRALARETGLWLVCGMVEETDGLPYNTAVVIDGGGDLVAAHRKTHLYDAFRWRESDDFRAGNVPFAPVETPWGRMGLAICYELRFPEVFTRQDCDFFVVPAAWVRGEHKKTHWRTLLAARAIENGVSVLGCTQVSEKVFTGGSAAFSPMGECIAEAGEEETVLEIALDLSGNDPTTRHNRRPELYGTKKA